MVKKKVESKEEEKQGELEKRLEDLGLELHLGRSLYNKLDERNKDVSNEIKKILEKLGVRSYEGRDVDMELVSHSYPQEVNPEVAGKYVPFDALLKMIRIDRKKFEADLTSREIQLKPEDYLLSPGTYDVVKPKVKLPIDIVRNQFKALYEMVVSLVIPEKKKR